MSGLTNTRKRTRELAFNSSLHTVYRSIEHPGSITATVEDSTEADRECKLILSEDDALRLAVRLAQQIGYKVVQS